MPSPGMPRSNTRSRGHEPVADVIGQDAPGAARDLSRQVRVPPDMIGVDRDADAFAQLVAEIVGMGERVDAGAIRGGHGMQRLDRERYRGRPRMRQHGGNAVADLAMRADQVLRPGRKPADHEDERAGADRGCFVDGAAVIVDCGAAACRVRSREHPAAAKAGDGQTTRADEPGCALDPAVLHNVAPWRDGGDAGAGAAVDRLLQRP